MKWLWRFPKEKKKALCLYLASKYLSHGKNKLTNPHLKYPASRKVLFGTERLLGKILVRLGWVIVSGFTYGMMFLLFFFSKLMRIFVFLCYNIAAFFLAMFTKNAAIANL